MVCKVFNFPKSPSYCLALTFKCLPPLYRSRGSKLYVSLYLYVNVLCMWLLLDTIGHVKISQVKRTTSGKFKKPSYAIVVYMYCIHRCVHMGVVFWGLNINISTPKHIRTEFLWDKLLLKSPDYTCPATPLSQPCLCWHWRHVLPPLSWINIYLTKCRLASISWQPSSLHLPTSRISGGNHHEGLR